MSKVGKLVWAVGHFETGCNSGIRQTFSAKILMYDPYLPGLAKKAMLPSYPILLNTGIAIPALQLLFFPSFILFLNTRTYRGNSWPQQTLLRE